MAMTLLAGAVSRFALPFATEDATLPFDEWWCLFCIPMYWNESSGKSFNLHLNLCPWGGTGVEFHETGRCEIWNRTIGASWTINGYQCYRLVKKADNRGCTLPACPPCRTAQEGEDCYVDVSWAMNNGIYSHPEWYLCPLCAFWRFSSVFWHSWSVSLF